MKIVLVLVVFLCATPAFAQEKSTSENVRALTVLSDGKQSNCGSYFRKDGDDVVFRIEGESKETKVPFGYVSRIETSQKFAAPSVRVKKLSDLVSLYTVLMTKEEKSKAVCLTGVYTLDVDQ